ncbi:GIY-YIG nuclease family protein [Mycolicibacterium llatzerense]|uniref:GIY-YIG nuclease family protein n=1 Tax=Mycolicibacterium llatzerense TaxID=280871 RepID=UPI000695C52A|nr:GIY-YIG nuclease family protein [Mycolicibacterium llatzerense]
MSQHVLYRFFDDSDRLLYVGITNDPEKRFTSHRNDKPWWRYVTTIKLQRFETRGQLASAELAAITTEKPKYNVANAGAEHTPTKTKARVSVSPGSTANVFATVQPEEDTTPYGCIKCMAPVKRQRGGTVVCIEPSCGYESDYHTYMLFATPKWTGSR